jgi:hypothetical protein
MGKVLKPLAVVAAIAVNVIPGAGQALSFALFSAAGAGFVSATVASIAAFAITAGITALGASALSGMRSARQNALGRLNLSFSADTPRKLWLGTTAGNTDVLYQEASGTDQEFIDIIIATSAHGIDGYESLYIEDKLAWTAAGGAQGIYVGYLTGTFVELGTTGGGVVINGGAKWGANSSLTGCSYLHLRIRRSGLTSRADSPFVSGLPGRMTIIGRGMRVYDPRRDTTVGGSGAQRANDQATWAFTDGSTSMGNNPALQLLTYMIGYRIGGVLSVGMGVPIERINMADFIAAANVCDEDVTLAAGGTQKRYQAAGVFTDADSPSDVLSALCASMNAKVRDTGGRIGLRMMINDTAGTLVEFGPDDMLSEYEWNPQAALNESFNVVRGSFVDPSTASLYQLAPYGERRVTSPDGIDRFFPLDLPLVQDGIRAQRIAEQVLQRGQIRGEFTCDFGLRALACEEGQPVRLTLGALGFSSKLFRVKSQELKIIRSEDDARAFCRMTLIEEDPAIYAWGTGDEEAIPAAVAAVSYNPTNQPFILTQGTDINVENGAVTGDNLQINSRMESNLDGFSAAGFTMTRVEGINNPPQKWVLQTTEGTNANEYQFPRFPVVGGRKVYISVQVMRTAALTDLRISANEYRADTGAGIGPVGGTQVIIPTTTGVWQKFEYEGTLSGGAGFMQPSIRLLAGNTGTVQVAALTVSYSQPGANDTATNAPLLVIPVDQAIHADSFGTPITGQLPRTLKASLFIGTTDVSSSTTWALKTATGGTLSTAIAEISSNGTITLKAQPAGGLLIINAIRDVVNITDTTLVTTFIAPSEGGSGGGTSQNWTSFTSSASTTFVEAGVEKTVTTGSAGTLTSSAPLNFTAVLGDGEFGDLEAKWQYRTPPGSGTWIDFAAAVADSLQAYGGDYSGEPEPAYDGFIGINQTKTGLTATTDYGVRLVFRSPSADTSQLYGTASVSGS